MLLASAIIMQKKCVNLRTTESFAAEELCREEDCAGE